MKKYRKTEDEASKFLSHQLFNDLPVSILLLDKKGFIVQANDFFLNWVNKNRGQVVGSSLLKAGGIKNKPIEQKLLRLLNRGTAFNNYQHTTYSPRKKLWYSLSISGRPVRDDKGEIIGAFSIAQDMTETAFTDQKVQQSNKELQNRVEVYTSKLSKLTNRLKQALRIQRDFFADASHELRTPLTIIKGNLDLIYLEKQKKPLSPNVMELVQNINTEMKRLTHLLSDITFLNVTDNEELFSKIGTDYKNMELNELLQSVVTNFSKEAVEKKLDLRIGALEPCSIQGDQENIKKAVCEILKNSLLYNTANGNIEVSLKNIKNHACITISDTGIGIPKKDLPHIFDRFSRTHPARGKSEGSGLGLAIAKRIIKDHRGTIQVKSRPGKGTVFIIKIPLVKEPVDANKAKIPNKELLHQVGEKILGTA